MNVGNPRVSDRWYAVDNADAVPSPALLVYPDRVTENIRRMIRLAGGAQRLRPHVKTHKTAEIVALQVAQGIVAFKCATIAEAEMTAGSGARDVLLAMQPVGPAVPRFLALARAFPGCAVSAMVDTASVIDAIARAAEAEGTVARLWLDINAGMNRTGIAPGSEAVGLYRTIHEHPSLAVAGLHVYDGHIHEHDIEARTRECEAGWAGVEAMLAELRSQGLPVPAVVAGGTPTFPIHARRPGVQLSPGTPLLWDHGYASSYRDLEFLVAAVILVRVVSKPAANLVCFDLGTKAVATEMPQPRVAILGIGNHRVVAHNEEHLVIDTPEASSFHVGDVHYAVPVHICPTVAKYEALHVIEDGRCAGTWPVVARNRTMTI